MRRARSTERALHVGHAGAKTDLSHEMHGRREIPAQKPSCPTNFPQPSVDAQDTKYRDLGFLFGRLPTSSFSARFGRLARGTTWLLCQNSLPDVIFAGQLDIRARAASFLPPRPRRLLPAAPSDKDGKTRNPSHRREPFPPPGTLQWGGAFSAKK